MSHQPVVAPDTGWPPRRLTVIYDDHCELCVRCANWLAGQPTHVEFRFLAASDPAVYDRYGDLPWYRIELMVVTDAGLAWVGSDAFVMCLWSTIRWHRMAYRISGPSFSGVAERFFHALSANRSIVSGMLTSSECPTGTCNHEAAPANRTSPPVRSGGVAR